VSSFDPSDDRTKLGSVSDDTSIYANERVRVHRTVHREYKNGSETQSDTDDYGVTQRGHTQSAHDHD